MPSTEATGSRLLDMRLGELLPKGEPGRGRNVQAGNVFSRPERSRLRQLATGVALLRQPVVTETVDMVTLGRHVTPETEPFSRVLQGQHGRAGAAGCEPSCPAHEGPAVGGPPRDRAGGHHRGRWLQCEEPQSPWDSGSSPAARGRGDSGPQLKTGGSGLPNSEGIREHHR